MASIRALLKINETGNGVMNSVTTNIETNNISVLPYTTNVTNWFVNQTTSNKNYRGAIVDTINSANNSKYGTAKYGVKQVSNNEYVNQYNGLMFKNPADLSQPFQITIEGTDIIAFNIHFDSAMGQHPLEYTVYSSITGTTTTYTTSDNIVRISNLSAGYGTTIITITDWYDLELPIAIKYVENVEIDLELDKYWIDNFESQTQIKSNASAIEYNTLPNTGNIKLIDKNNKLYEYSQMGYLNDNLFSLQIFINEVKLQKHTSMTSPYYANNGTLTLELTNELQNWNNVIVPEKTYPQGTNLLDVLVDVLSYVGFNRSLVENILFYGGHPYYSSYSSSGIYNMRYAFQCISLNIFTLKSGSVIEQLNKICQVAQCAFVYDKNSNLSETFTIYSLKPRKSSSEKVINIPYEKQYGTFDYSILTDNRYDWVSFDNETITLPVSKNILKLQSNEILDVAYFVENNASVNRSMKYVIRESIIDDYSRGIKSANLKIFPSDYYYTDGTRAKRWKNGGMIGIGEVIRIEDRNGEDLLKDVNNQDVYFKVVDRKVIYEGQILIELSLMEIKN